MWSALTGLALKVIMLLLKGDTNIEVKTTGEVLEPDPVERNRMVEFLRMHYKNTGGDRSSVDASNFKRDH